MGTLAAVPPIIVDLGVIAGVLATLVALSRTPPVRWLWCRLVAQPVTEWVERLLAPIHDRLERVEHEVKTNDGSSLRDVADRTEALARRLDEHLVPSDPP